MQVPTDARKEVRVPGVKRGCEPPSVGAEMKASILNLRAISLDPLHHLKLFFSFLKILSYQSFGWNISLRKQQCTEVPNCSCISSGLKELRE